MDTLIIAGANEFIIPYDKLALKEDIKLYRSITGLEIYLIV